MRLGLVIILLLALAFWMPIAVAVRNLYLELATKLQPVYTSVQWCPELDENGMKTKYMIECRWTRQEARI